MAAVSEKDTAAHERGTELQQGLKGMKVGTLNLSTLAQKGNEEVFRNIPLHPMSVVS